MLTALVQAGILGLEGKEFASLDRCPSCGGEVTGYDVKERRFAVLADESGTRPVNVMVKRFSCRECGLVSSARAPFYPDTRMGSPIVDLCVILSKEMPASRVAGVVRDLSLVVDRGTVRNYSRRDFGVIPVTGIFGLSIPQSLMTLSLMGMQAP
jgi:hypothetical protein